MSNSTNENILALAAALETIIITKLREDISDHDRLQYRKMGGDVKDIILRVFKIAKKTH